MKRHNFRGRRFISNDVPSMATSRYRPTTPQATGPGFHSEASGTNSSDIPKWAYESATRPARWTTVKVTASPPRNRWRSSSHFGVGRPLRILVEYSKPHTTDAVRMTSAMIPDDLATYHQICSFMTGTPPFHRRDARHRRR